MSQKEEWSDLLSSFTQSLTSCCSFSSYVSVSDFRWLAWRHTDRIETTVYSQQLRLPPLCLRVLAGITSERRDRFSSSRSLSFLWSVSLTKPPEAASTLVFLSSGTEKHRVSLKCAVRFRRYRSRGRRSVKCPHWGAAGLVLALLSRIGVKLQQLVLQVQLVVQLGHLQTTHKVSCLYILRLSRKKQRVLRLNLVKMCSFHANTNTSSVTVWNLRCVFTSWLAHHFSANHMILVSWINWAADIEEIKAQTYKPLRQLQIKVILIILILFNDQIKFFVCCVLSIRSECVTVSRPPLRFVPLVPPNSRSVRSKFCSSWGATGRFLQPTPNLSLSIEWNRKKKEHHRPLKLCQ